MNKVKYPDQNKIDKHISMILDESGLFDDYGKNQEFIECRKIHTKKVTVRTIVSLIAVAAVVTFAIVLTAKIAPRDNNKDYEKIEPLTNVEDNDTMSTDKDGSAVSGSLSTDNGDDSFSDAVSEKTDDSIAYKIGTLEAGQVVVNWADSSKQIYYVADKMCRVGIFTNKIPVVSYNGINVSSITEYFENRYSELYAESMNKYNGFEYDPAESVYVNGQTWQSSDDKLLPVQINIGNIPYSSVNRSGIISFCEIYSEYSRQADGNILKRDATFGVVFDVEENRLMTLEDLFTDYEAGMAEVEEKCHDVGTLNEGCWYINNDSLVVSFPDDKTYTSDNVTTTMGTVIELPLKELEYVKDRFK